MEGQTGEAEVVNGEKNRLMRLKTSADEQECGVRQVNSAAAGLMWARKESPPSTRTQALTLWDGETGILLHLREGVGCGAGCRLHRGGKNITKKVEMDNGEEASWDRALGYTCGNGGIRSTCGGGRGVCPCPCCHSKDSGCSGKTLISRDQTC